MWKRGDQENAEPLSSTIRYDRGADWFSEEVEGGGERRSYQMVALHRIGDDVLCYQAMEMPAEWVGYDLLESKRLSYRCWKVSHEARWEFIGGWERCIVEDTGKSVDTQWEAAQAWMRGGVAPRRGRHHYIKRGAQAEREEEQGEREGEEEQGYGV